MTSTYRPHSGHLPSEFYPPQPPLSIRPCLKARRGGCGDWCQRRGAVSPHDRPRSSAQQAVLGLRGVEGLGADEVAAALGISAGNERVLLHRARSLVRRELEEYFDQ